jgi:hypothetical protein
MKSSELIIDSYFSGQLLACDRLTLPGADSNIGPDSAVWHAIQDNSENTLAFTYTPPVNAFIVVNLLWIMSASEVSKRVEYHILTTPGAGYQSEGRITTPAVAHEQHYPKTMGLELPAEVAITFSPMYYNVDSNTISTKAGDHSQLCYTVWAKP